MELLRVLLVLLWLIFVSHATVSLAKETVVPIEQIAGVYKVRKPNGFYNGTDTNGKSMIEKYISEDILEITPYEENSFYFRKETMFFNGHPCGIYGIAVQTAPKTYVFDDNEDDPKMHCRLQVTLSKSKFEFQDITPRDESLEWQRACHSYCGARGYINDSWDRSNKRAIRYLPRLQNSLEYRAAVRSYENQISLHDAMNHERKKDSPRL